MSFFNTNKKFQINRVVDERQNFFRIIVSNCGLSTCRKKWTLKCILSWLLFGSCTSQEVRPFFLKNVIIFLQYYQTKTKNLLKKVELRLSTLVRTPKINRVLKKRTYFCCSSIFFCFVSLTLPLFSKVTSSVVL